MLLSKTKFSIATETISIFVAFFTLYAFTICGVNAAAHDSIFYLIRIDSKLKLRYSNNPLFHPHHLLYNPMARLWLTAFRTLGVTWEADFIICLMNALFGSLTLCVIYLLLRKRLNLSRGLAILGTSLPAFSFAFWFYSVCLEVCIPPLFFLMLAFYLLTAEHLKLKTFAIAGILTGLAIILHQAHVLFIPVVSYVIYKNKSWKAAGCYLLTLLPTIIIPYAAVALSVLKFNSWQAFMGWFGEYLQQPAYWNSLAGIGKAGIGFARSLVGGYFLFALPSFNALADKILKGNWLVDDVFLVRNLNPIFAYILAGLTIIFFLVLVVSSLRYLFEWRLFKDNKIITLSGIWFAVYTIFTLFWVASNAEFWIVQSLCFWLIFVGLSTQALKKPLLVLSILAGLLFTLNFMGSIKFLRDNDNDFYYQKSAPLAKLVKNDDLIIIGPSPSFIDHPSASWNSWTLHSYLLNYTNANVMNLILDEYEYPPKPTPKRYIRYLGESIEKTLAKGNKVFIYQEAVENVPYVGKATKAIEDLWNTYQSRWQRLEVGTETVYVVK